MPLGIITKNTPERLTIDLYERLHRSKNSAPGISISPWYTYGKISTPGSIAFRNYWQKRQFPTFFKRLTFYRLSFWQSFLAGGKKPKVLDLSCVPDTHTENQVVLDYYTVWWPFGQSGSYWRNYISTGRRTCWNFICRLGSQDEWNDASLETRVTRK